MGLFKKVKEILFDEEEYTEQIKITPEMRNEPQAHSKVEMKEVKEVAEVKPTVQPKEEPVKDPVSEKEVFKSDNFPFLDFDEEEFEKEKPVPVKEEVVVQKPAPRYSNVLEFERKKRVEKRNDYGRYEKTEIVETTERRKFKPSPIISPVYGVLDKDYKKEDIEKLENERVDIQKIRDKAFGEPKIEPKIEPKVTNYYDQEETVTISKPLETAEKVKTIDELLEDTSDVVVDIDNDLENELHEVEQVIEKNKKQEKETEQTKELPRVKEEDDTLEGDLFDLIDSMYDSKEGE